MSVVAKFLCGVFGTTSGDEECTGLAKPCDKGPDDTFSFAAASAAAAAASAAAVAAACCSSTCR